jgi:Na+/H+ antiporter NhaD/arsenite permease-like protein
MLRKKFKGDVPGYLLMASIFIISTIIALLSKISITTIMKDYQFSVLIILIVMDLFTNLISSTGVIEKISLKIAVISKGQQKKCLILFGLLIFFVSAFLNNITAVLIVLPIIFVLLKVIGIDQKYLNVFFATFLALSNTGGASSPIGDFPAIVIMDSGITTFSDYLFRAFPFFFIISVALIFWWQLFVKENNKNDKKKNLSIDLLKSKYKNIEVNKKVLTGLMIIFVLMFISWSLVPQDVIPPEVTALLGCVVGIVYAVTCGVEVKPLIDFKPVLTIASFLFLANVIAHTEILSTLANSLQSHISDSKILLIAIMFMTSLMSGLFGAGPAASAMMPIIIYLCETTFKTQADWIAIAYASAICAGSSLFMWSATAGFILSKNVNEANLVDSKRQKMTWNISNYMKYGVQNYLIQISLSIGLIYIVIM